MKFLMLFILALTITSNPRTVSAADQSHNTPVHYTELWELKGNTMTVHQNWCKKLASKKEKCEDLSIESKNDFKPIDYARKKVSEEQKVVVNIEGFNFINYKLSVDVDEQVIESYVFLDDIFKQLLGLKLTDFTQFLSNDGNMKMAAEQESKSAVDFFQAWLESMEDVNNDLVNLASNYHSDSILDQAELTELGQDLASLEEEIAEMTQNKQATNQLVRNGELSLDEFSQIITLYNIFDTNHQSLQKISNTFISLAKQSLNGYPVVIGKKKSGTAVDISITAKNANTGLPNPRESINISYLAESKLPVIFHGGMTLNALGNSSFEKVRATTNRDLFTQVKDESATSELSVFMSYPFPSKKEKETEWYGTLGTNINDLGDVVYFGISRRLRDKWFVSLGGAYGNVTTGMNMTSDSDESGMPTRDLFELIEEDREVDFFFSISYSFFDF